MASVQLVDVNGNAIRAPYVEEDAAFWPASNEGDGWHWEISDAAVVAELERAALEAECDFRDQFDPPAGQVSDVEWSMLNGGLPLG